MIIPCVCPEGIHTFSETQMALIIAAFQRGELSKVRLKDGKAIRVIPVCLAKTDFSAGEAGKFSGICGVEMDNGAICLRPRGHTGSRHGPKIGKKGKAPCSHG